MEPLETGCPFEAPLRAMLCKACCASNRNSVPPCVRSWLQTVVPQPELMLAKGSHRPLPTAA